MYIHELSLQNIGPFTDAQIEFIKEGKKRNNITIITGENGGGKSIILDAIRGLLGGAFSKFFMKREIVREPNNFSISMILDYGLGKKKLSSHSINEDGAYVTDNHELNGHLYHRLNKTQFSEKWIIDYWTSQISIGDFALDSITKLNTESYLNDGLVGKQNILDVVKLITFFEYLSGSENKSESSLGKVMFVLIKNLINECLNYGAFSHISRITLQPILKVRGQELTLDKLSSGNIYLIQRLLSLVYKAYSAYETYGGDPSEINKTKGILLIDEIENHLHPKWQKKILKIIRNYFPNIQIILTTHSPFIVSSVDNINVFVCKMGEDKSVIIDETDFYKNKPIEEIIRTPLFATDSFNEEISELLVQRKTAIKNDNKKLANEIEKHLIEKNPEYFRYFKLDDIND